MTTFVSYPNCITDDALSICQGSDIIITQAVTFFLPISNDNKDPGGIFPSPILGSEQFRSVKKESPEVCEQTTLAADGFSKVRL